MKTHQMSYTTEYKSWRKMLERCSDTRNNRYASHGARGITVCEEWKKFENFIRDMGNKPTPKHSIERKDNNGNYEPSNCRWATSIEQANNRRTNRYYTHNGETKTFAEWCRITGIKRNTVTSRLHYGWTEEKALGLV